MRIDQVAIRRLGDRAASATSVGALRDLIVDAYALGACQAVDAAEEICACPEGIEIEDALRPVVDSLIRDARYEVTR